MPDLNNLPNGTLVKINYLKESCWAVIVNNAGKYGFYKCYFFKNDFFKTEQILVQDEIY